MTVDEYIEIQAEEIRPVLETVRSEIAAVLPDAEQKISWQMPTFRKRVNLIPFAAMKNHLGIYPGAEAVEAFSEELKEKKYRFSKGRCSSPMTEWIWI